VSTNQELIAKLKEQVSEVEINELTKTRIVVKVPPSQVRTLAETLMNSLPDISGEQVPTVASLSDLWPGFNWHERETWEMFGIVFDGHPNLDLLLLSEDLRGKYPLRKSFVIDRDRTKEAVVTPPRPKRPEKDSPEKET